MPLLYAFPNVSLLGSVQYRIKSLCFLLPFHLYFLGVGGFCAVGVLSTCMAVSFRGLVYRFCIFFSFDYDYTPFCLTD